MTTPRLYRLLLKLLPRARRSRHGADMAHVFDELTREERTRTGRRGVARLWLRETLGLARFAFRDRLANLTLRQRPGLRAEFRWACRSLQARRGSALVAVGLLAVTLAANAVTFSVVDSLVLRIDPYKDADRIFVLDHSAPGRIGRAKAAELMSSWRAQTDIFASVGGYLQKTIFLTEGTLENVTTADITVGLLEVLGAAPRWGRGLIEADLHDTGTHAVLISEDLARARFGSPERAVGQRLEATGGGPLLVVGVMASDFAFPSTSYRIWRALDPSGPLAANSGAPLPLARLADGANPEDFGKLLEQRARLVADAAGVAGYAVQAKPAFQPRPRTERQTMLLLLLGGAICLQLMASANVASLELAAVTKRVASRRVRLALGASRGSLVRVQVLEGSLILASALVLGIALAVLTLPALTALLSDFAWSTHNRIDLDYRALLFASYAAVITWLLASLLPAMFPPRRASSVSALTAVTTTTSRRNAAVRQVLTAFEVAAAVALVIVGLLYVRSYRALLDVEKGFDSHGLAVISAPLPAYYFTTPAERAIFMERVSTELRALPGIAGVTDAAPPPELGDSPSAVPIAIDDGEQRTELRLGRKWVDTSYFAVTRIQLLRGRYLEPGDPPTNVVIAESLARKFWPRGEAVGHIMRGPVDSGFPQPMTIVGVVADFRTEATRMPDETDTRAYVYTLRQPTEPPLRAEGSAPEMERFPDNGGMSSFISLTVRMDSPGRAGVVQAAVQRIDPRIRVSVDLVDDMYAKQNADLRIAGQVIGGFSALAFLVAIFGLYGVLAFLVSIRTRELGIRVALGARRADINRLVFGSSIRMVFVGSVVGGVAAYAAARWIEAQLFGVSPLDPTTYAVVIGFVAATALAATWLPARQAARIDPAITLRAE